MKEILSILIWISGVTGAVLSLVVLVELSAEKADIINLYIAKHAALADKDCAFLYEQGVKDCVKLLKRLGVL